MNTLQRLIELYGEDAVAAGMAPQFTAAGVPVDLNRAPPPMNSITNEQTGRVTFIEPSQPVAPQGTPQGRLGDRVEVPGRGVGRYSPDGRSVVFKDGSTYDLHPEKSFEDSKRAFEQRRNEQLLAQGDIALEQGREQLAATRAQREVREDPNTAAALEKRFGKAEKGYRWTADGRLEPIPGGSEAESTATAITGAEETIRKIDEMIGARDAQGNLVKGSKAHAGFEDAVGATWKPFARLLPGTDAADFSARLDEIKGGAFLKAFESLKGGGQITEMEGKKATDAITRMSLAQSEKEFVKAAREFRNVVSSGLQRAQAKSGGVGSPQAVAPANRSRLISEARFALAKGAPREQVLQRLQGMGINDSGL